MVGALVVECQHRVDNLPTPNPRPIPPPTPTPLPPPTPPPPCCPALPQVRVPMFFMLGAKDRRVPMDDAKQYINALRCGVQLGWHSRQGACGEPSYASQREWSPWGLQPSGGNADFSAQITAPYTTRRLKASPWSLCF